MTSPSQPSQALIRVTTPTLVLTRPHRTVGGPGSTIATAYDWAGQKITHGIGKVAHKLGKGPEFPTKAIEEAFGLEVNQTLKRLCDLHDCKGQPSSGCGGWGWDIDKLEHCCTGLIEYTSPLKTAKTQLEAFKKILRVITSYPGLRPVLCRDKSIKDKDPASLWKPSDDDCMTKEWKLFRQVAASCITEENLEVTMIVEKVRPNEFGKFSDHSKSVIEELATIATDTINTSEFVRIIAIGYLGGILRLPPFWSEERNKGMPAVKLLESAKCLVDNLRLDSPHPQIERNLSLQDTEGIDLLLQAVVIGMEAWAKELQRPPTHQSDIPWRQLSVNLMESVQGKEAALFLPRSTLAISQVTALRAPLTEPSDITNAPAWIEGYQLQQSDVTTEPPESKYIYSRPAPITPEGLPRKPLNVSSWPRHLSAWITLDAMFDSDGNDPITDTTALELQRMREIRTKHDYFIAKFQCIDGGIRYIRIERFDGNYEFGTAGQSLFTSVSPWLKLFKRRPPSDRVTTVDGWPNDTPLENFDVSRLNITLYSLAMAAQKVGAYDDQYKGLKRQSYWFSYMIMRVLESVYKFPASDQPPAVDIHEYRGIPTYGLFSAQRRPKSEDVALIAEGFSEEYERTISELNAERQQRLVDIEAEDRIQAAMEPSLRSNHKQLV
ncbi:hypothetical protein BU17DRAFT_94819 [Hysterangium stoloniferum]|nr:hypothetical protein BU17DRAFT_94819 [Hysterangium stoloniferum]